MSQLAKLYLRGSLVNKTMKNLNIEQRELAEKRLLELIEDQGLAKCKEVFCRVLSQTIGNEYLDKNVALIDYKIALWRGVVNALFHKPSPEVFDDSRQREKYFKTWVYNYMRQILNENKRPTTSSNSKILAKPHTAANLDICNVLTQCGIEHTVSFIEPSSYEISGEISLVDKKTAERLGGMCAKYHNHGVIILVNRNVIRITGPRMCSPIEVSIKRSSRIKMTSLEVGHDDDNDTVRYNIEYQYIHHLGDNPQQRRMEDHDKMGKFRSALPVALKEIYDEIMNSPTVPKKDIIAKNLGLSSQEVSRRMDRLGVYYCTFA